MKRILIFLYLLTLLLVPAFASAEVVYKWVDEKGLVHLSDNLYQFPEKFRDQIQKIIVPDSVDEPVRPSEKSSAPSIVEPEKPKAARAPPFLGSYRLINLYTLPKE